VENDEVFYGFVKFPCPSYAMGFKGSLFYRRKMGKDADG
jgi:hypothetical protein